MIRLPFLAAAVLICAGATGSLPTVKVPRGPAPTIDGVIDSTEWRGAAVERLSNGLTVRLQHDGTYLFLAISSTGEGFPSICAVKGDTLRVLHASAALGAMIYTRTPEGWSRRDTVFVYGMRNTELTPAARDERRAYLAEHRWVASTFRMGQGRAHELQLSLALLDRVPRIAVGYYRTQGAQAAWPESLVAEGEGCGELRLLQGYASSGPRFRPDMYVELELEP